MTSKEAILFGLRRSGMMVQLFTSDLSAEELHYRIVPEANCAAWILGHLTLYDRSLLKRLGAPPGSLPALPYEDFEKRFGREEDAPRAGSFGDAQILPAVFKSHRDALFNAVEAADAAEFDKALPQPSRIASTLGELLLFDAIHVAMHIGQISAIRRSLGRPPLV